MNIVEKSSGKFFLLDEAGEELSTAYKSMEQIKDYEIALVKRDSINGTLAIVDFKGKRITEWFESVGEFNQFELSKIKRVDLDSPYALMDKSGTKATAWFDNISDYNKYNLALIQNIKRNENQLAFINSTGEFASDWFSYILKAFNKNGYVVVVKDTEGLNDTAVFDSSGKRIGDWYYSIQFSDDHTAIAIKDNGQNRASTEYVLNLKTQEAKKGKEIERSLLKEKEKVEFTSKADAFNYSVNLKAIDTKEVPVSPKPKQEKPIQEKQGSNLKKILMYVGVAILLYLFISTIF